MADTEAEPGSEAQPQPQKESPFALTKTWSEAETNEPILPINQDQIQQLCQYLTQIPDGYRLMDQFAQGLKAAKNGHGHNASMMVLGVGVALFNRGKQIDPQATERFFRIAIQMARSWDIEVPKVALAALSGKNQPLAECNVWMASSLIRRGRQDEAEQFYNAAVNAVCESDVQELGKKLHLLAQLHRVHTKNKDKHKAVIRRWGQVIDERKKEECSGVILAARATMINERIQLYNTRNKTLKAYNLGKSELLECVRRLERLRLIPNKPLKSAEVHFLLSRFSVKMSEPAQAEWHMRLCLYCRLRDNELLAGEQHYAEGAEPEDLCPPSASASADPARALDAGGATGPGSEAERRSAEDASASSGEGPNVLGMAWDGRAAGTDQADFELGHALRNLGEHLTVHKRLEEALAYFKAAAPVFLQHHPDEFAACHGLIGMTEARRAQALLGLEKGPGGASSPSSTKAGAPGKTKGPGPKAIAQAKQMQESALTHLATAIAMIEKLKGETARELVDLLIMRAEMSWELKRAFDTERDLTRALAISREKNGDQHPMTKRLLAQLVEYKTKMKAMQVALGRLE